MPAGPFRYKPRLNGVEALMWGFGHRGGRAATMSLVVGLDGTVGVDAVRARAERVVAKVPRLAARVHASPLPGAAPRWAPDPAFDVARQVSCRPGADAAEVISAPLPADRPPWRAVLARQPDGRDALILHLHHSYTDGLGGLELVGELLDVGPVGPGAGGEPAPSGPPSGGVSTPSLLDEVCEDVARAAGLVVRAAPWALRSLRSAWQEPTAVVSRAAAAVLDTGGPASVAATPASPLLAARSDGIALGYVDLPVEDMRRAGKRVGGTLNDVFLAGLLDGMGRYHDKLGPRPAALRMGMPVSTRGASGPVELHNQFDCAVLRGPLAPLDFDERVRLVHEMVITARAQPWLPLTEPLAGLGIRVPGMVPLAAKVLSSLDLVASNVTGPPVEMWLVGVPVSSMTPVGPRSGAAVNVTLLSYRGRAHLGLNIDPAAVPDPGLLVDCVRAAFDDVL